MGDEDNYGQYDHRALRPSHYSPPGGGGGAGPGQSAGGDRYDFQHAPPHPMMEQALLSSLAEPRTFHDRIYTIPEQDNLHHVLDEKYDGQLGGPRDQDDYHYKQPPGNFGFDKKAPRTTSEPPWTTSSRAGPQKSPRGVSLSGNPPNLRERMQQQGFIY